MKKYINFSLLCLTILLVIALPVNSFASSWNWENELRPYMFLHFAILFSVIAECLSLCFIAKIKKPLKAIFITVILNFFEFSLYYFHFALRNYRSEQTFTEILSGCIGIYNVNILSILFAIFLEMPILYIAFSRDTENKNKLISVIFFSNLATMLTVYIFERFVLCRGFWI